MLARTIWIRAILTGLGMKLLLLCVELRLAERSLQHDPLRSHNINNTGNIVVKW